MTISRYVGGDMDHEVRAGIFCQTENAKRSDQAPLLRADLSTTIIVRLPQQIYDHTIDHLHKDKPSLHHFSLVSSW